MAMTSRKNALVKALQAHMAACKKISSRSLLEWEISCNTNNNRGHVWDQSEIISLYSNSIWKVDANGASKACHIKNHMGQEFKHIVIKRHLSHGHMIDGKNQLISEINCWNEFAESENADYLCPILKYFTSKSDKVTDTSDTMRNNVIIIAQKAVYVSNANKSCKKAEELNKVNGYIGEAAQIRYNKLNAMANRQGWWDVMREAEGNCGVIFDYSKNCYKAVFIDYAL